MIKFYTIRAACMVVFAAVICTVGIAQTLQAGLPNAKSVKSSLKGAVIKNNIWIEPYDVKVSAAYLMTPDAQFKATNTAKLNERVILTLELDTGWTKIGGKSYIGAYEQILDAEGTVILDTEDLFAAYDKEGLGADVALNINLSAIIDSIQPGLNEFTVRFKVWDKRGKGVILGSFKLIIE
ncbi:MAG: hypothetical protein MUF24_08300 [Chitinophagaceae bacterium]|nr:hypothetical protein [Chitinophagaceae bacterium]